jgi:hypothetical protein
MSTGPGAAPPVIATIGDINVTSMTISAPTGTVPLRGSLWNATDHWQSERRTPKWAIVVAIAGICFTALLSLLFLLVRTETYTAFVTVSVTNGTFFYTTRIAAATPAQVQEIYDRVNYVRSLAVIGS